ncbi:MAG: 3-oxoacyl-ACP synthase [Rickettsiaceae bacterium]|jgi:3-oxoacyl-[acyl-carrier-protein] synthase III|nr:3-oxoacyl-ACP synthase [Rickettsiaceae bacterium]
MLINAQPLTDLNFMKIEAVSLSLPSWKVSNEEVIDLIRFHSKPKFSGDLEKTLRKIDIILRKTGAETRFWLNRQIKEKPIDHIKKAAEESLKKANLEKDDIDLLVYVGIGKGFLEPGNAYAIAHSLGMKRVRCFDITDACMSWIATMQVVDSLFKTGAYKSAMIVNGEFTVQAGTFFKNYALTKEEQLTYTFPTFTIGEGATCTILSPNDPKNFSFNFSSRADLSDLCVVPLDEYKDYCEPTEKTANNGAMHFTSYGYDLHDTGQTEIVKLFKSASIEREDIDIVFTHASSKSEWHKYGEKVGIEDKIYHIYQHTGNLISASIPGAMALAEKEGKLKKKDHILFWVGSAGMSFATSSFKF